MDPTRAIEALSALSSSPRGGVWRAPGRINVIGEHTDYNDGFVLPAAINQHVVVAASRRSDGVIRCTSTRAGAAPDIKVADLEPSSALGWWAYPYGVAWALREAGIELRGADLAVDSSIPAGAGLSSSAALCVAVGLALVELSGGAADRDMIARSAQRAEHDWAGTPCGLMDQTASLAGRAGAALLLDTRTMEVEHIALALDAADLDLLVLDTGVTHSLASGAYADRRASCARAAEILGVPMLRDATPVDVDAAAAALGPAYPRARHVVAENLRVLAVADLLRAGRVADIGPNLAASHVSLRDDFEVSCVELDLAVATAVDNGAIGARMTGGGFGGSAVALAPRGRTARIATALHEAFERAGRMPPTVRRAVPSDGARRIE